jgi:hypothetical protein
MRLRDLTEFDKEAILGSLGLQSKPSSGAWALGTFGLFGLGVLVGAGVALLLAPSPGSELRRNLGERAKTVRDQVSAKLANGQQQLENSL